MIKLLRHNFNKILTSKTFWISSALYLTFCLILNIYAHIKKFPLELFSISYDLPLINYGFCGSPFSGFLILIYLSVIIGNEFNNNAIRNKILIGHSKNKIYLSNVLACAVCSLAVNLIFILIALCLAPYEDLDAKIFLLILLNNILTVILYVSVYTLIIFITKNTTATIIIGGILTTTALLLSILLLGDIVNNSTVEWLYLMALYPTGIDVALTNLPLIKCAPFIFLIYTPLAMMIMIVLTTAIGMKIFNKANLK